MFEIVYCLTGGGSIQLHDKHDIFYNKYKKYAIYHACRVCRKRVNFALYGCQNQFDNLNRYEYGI